MFLGDAPLHRELSPSHLPPLPHSLLAKYGQRDDSSFQGNPVGDPNSLPIEMKLQLVELADEPASVGLAEQGAALG
jgi:hypothetical protein